MTVTLTNPYKKVITFKNRSTQIRVNLYLDQNPQQEWQLEQSKYGPKQTDHDIADGNKRSFVYWFNFGNTSILLMAMVYRRPSRKYERDTLWQSRNGAFDFPHFSGDFSPSIQDPANLVRCFHYCHYSAKPGKEWVSGNSQTIGSSRASQTTGYVICGDFPIAIPKCHYSDRTTKKPLLGRLKNIGMASKKNCIETP